MEVNFNKVTHCSAMPHSIYT